MIRIFAAIAALILPIPAHAQTPGPIPAELERVIDGDTIVVHARPWPQMSVEVNVRLAEVDTPEVGWRADCAHEKEMAEQATEFTQAFLEGRELTLHDVQLGSFAGRVVASVEVGGDSLAAALVMEGLAVPYEQGGDNAWCDDG